jgi:uncharacterized damage-inducible protein DinB
MSDLERVLRDQLVRHLDGGLTFRAVDDLLDGWPMDKIGDRAPGHPHTAWQLVWHVRHCQRDLIEFIESSDYQAGDWPGDYWPEDATPPDDLAWDRALSLFREDRRHLRALLEHDESDLLQVSPTGDGETMLRSMLMILEHNAYHLGQLAVLRRALGVPEE